MTHTTRFYRAEAQAEEKVLNWFRAAACWRQAVKVYPESMARGPMGQIDKQNMMKRAETCDRMERAKLDEAAGRHEPSDF